MKFNEHGFLLDSLAQLIAIPPRAMEDPLEPPLVAAGAELPNPVDKPPADAVPERFATCAERNTALRERLVSRNQGDGLNYSPTAWIGYVHVNEGL